MAKPNDTQPDVTGMTCKQALSLDQESARGTFSKFERQLFDPIDTASAACRSSEIMTHWDLGAAVATANRELHEALDEENRGVVMARRGDKASQDRAKKEAEETGKVAKLYAARGETFFERASAALGYSSTTPLLNAMAVVDAFPDRTEFETFSQMSVPKSAARLSWQHFVVLSRVEATAQQSEEERREHFARVALKEKLSADALWKKINGRVSTGSKAGRKPLVPKGPLEGLQHISEQARRLTKLTEHSWRSDSFDIRKQLTELDDALLTEEMMSSVEETVSVVQELKDAVEDLLLDLTIGKNNAAQRLAEADVIEAEGGKSEIRAAQEALEKEPEDGMEAYDDEDFDDTDEDDSPEKLTVDDSDLSMYDFDEDDASIIADFNKKMALSA